MRFSIVLGYGLAAVAAPAVAQTAPATEPKKIYSIEAEVAPQWATETPWDYDDITDSTSVSLTFSASPTIAPGVALQLSAGPKATLDDDNDSSRGSAFGFSGKLKFGDGLVKPFVKGAYDKKFTDFFADSNGSERAYTGGLEFGYDIKRSTPEKKKPTLSASAEVGMLDGTDDAVDQSFAQLKAGFKILLWSFGKFDIEAKGARRWLEHADVSAGIKERRTEWGGSVGVDFARGITDLLGGDPDGKNPWLRKFKAGYNFLRRKSNIEGNDKSSSSPSLALAVGQDF